MVWYEERSRGGRGVTGCVGGNSSQLVKPVGDACSVPANGIGTGGEFGAEVHVVDFELHSDDTDVIGRAGGNGDGARDHRTRGRRRDRDARGEVIHGYKHGSGGTSDPGGITRNGAQKVCAAAVGSCVP